MTRRVTFRLALLSLVDFTWGLLASRCVEKAHFDFRAIWYEVLMYRPGVLVVFLWVQAPFCRNLKSKAADSVSKNESLSCRGGQYEDILLFCRGGKWMDPEEYLCYFGIWYGYCQAHEACAYLLDRVWQRLPVKSLQDWGTFLSAFVLLFSQAWHSASTLLQGLVQVKET